MSILDKIRSQNKNKEDKQTKNVTYLDFLQRSIPKSSTSIQQTSLFPANNQNMKEINNLIWQVSLTKVPILIKGEKGVGKKFIAQKIHETSNKQKNENIGIEFIDCLKEREDYLGKTLFGPNKEENVFSRLSNGTLVLENITSLSQAYQSKLLNIIQEKKILLNSQEPAKPISTRIIATTACANINEAIKRNILRQDLYYRLYVIQIEVPPLRERKEDLLELSLEIIEKSENFNKEIPLSKEALTKLDTHKWIGNIDELKNVLTNALKKSNGQTITPEHISFHEIEHHNNIHWAKFLPIGESIKTLERQFIIQTLFKHNGNRTHAAKTLGISLRTLRNKINEFNDSGFSVPESTSYPSKKSKQAI